MPPQGVLHGLERTHERAGVLLAVHPGEKLEGVAQALALLPQVVELLGVGAPLEAFRRLAPLAVKPAENTGRRPPAGRRRRARPGPPGRGSSARGLAPPCATCCKAGREYRAPPPVRARSRRMPRKSRSLVPPPVSCRRRGRRGAPRAGGSSARRAHPPAGARRGRWARRERWLVRPPVSGRRRVRAAASRRRRTRSVRSARSR